MNLRAETENLSAPSGPPVQAKPAVGSFETTFRENVGMVTRVLRSMGVPEAMVDDATQDVFVVVHRKLSEFEGRSKLSTWICSITYRVGFNYRRRSSKNDRFEPWEEKHTVPGESPETTAIAESSRRLVASFCAELEEPMRDVFVFCFLEERSAKEVAALLDVSPNTVYSRIRLLRAAFREELAAQA